MGEDQLDNLEPDGPITLRILDAGAYLGGALGHGLPLGRQDSIITID